jgi:hypothetical protein
MKHCARVCRSLQASRPFAVLDKLSCAWQGEVGSQWPEDLEPRRLDFSTT